MVFSDGSYGIVEDIDFLCQTDSTSYPLVDKARNANRHYYKFVVDWLKAGGRWQFDDSNLTTPPTITVDLVAGQQDYELPTNVLKLEAVEILDNAANSYRISEIDISDLQLTITDFEETDSRPLYYDIKGSKISLFPAPAAGSVTLTGGLKIYVSREIDAFTAADTTQEPGIPEPFHRGISLGAAYDWLCVNGTHDRADRVLQQYEQLRKEFREFLSSRNQDKRTAFKPLLSTRNYM